MFSTIRNLFKKEENYDSQPVLAADFLPEDVWIEILLRIDDITLFKARLVCQLWRKISESPSFWLRKCHRAGRLLPKLPSHRSELLDYRKIYFKPPFGRNLIRNPSGEDEFKDWNLTFNGGDNFTIEKPPVGSDTEGFPICFATSYGLCLKQQLIDLEKEGCYSWIIDELQPKIFVSEWHAARVDCASTYELHVTLLRNPSVVTTPNMRANVYDRNRDQPYLLQNPDNVVGEFHDMTIVEQWVGKAWQEKCDFQSIAELLPEDVWIEILLRIEDETLFRIRLVCRLWREILESPSFWLRKCLRMVRVLPKVPSHLSEFLNYRKIYFKNPFGRNLISNPSGEDIFKHWNFVLNGGDHFRIEKPPSGSDTDGFPICFATSYGPCIKQQLIALEKEGCDSWIIDELQPKISVSEWHAARFDCASTYELHVTLLRSPSVVTVGGSPPFGRNRNEPFLTQNSDNVVKEFRETTVVEQWVGKAWQETFHTFENYGSGVRYVLFQSSGIDNQFWAGHFGPKMAKAHVSLIFE